MRIAISICFVPQLDQIFDYSRYSLSDFLIFVDRFLHFTTTGVCRKNALFPYQPQIPTLTCICEGAFFCSQLRSTWGPFWASIGPLIIFDKLVDLKISCLGP